MQSTIEQDLGHRTIGICYIPSLLLQSVPVLAQIGQFDFQTGQGPRADGDLWRALYIRRLAVFLIVCSPLRWQWRTSLFTTARR